MPQFTVRSSNRANELRETNLSTVECIVYDQDDQVADLSQFLTEVRRNDPPVPFLFVVQPDSHVAVSNLLAAEQTDVFRTDDQSADVPLLAHRIEMLVEADRRRKKLAQVEGRYDTLFKRLTQPAVETRFDCETPIVERVNQSFEDTFGYDRSEIVGESLDAYIVPPDRTEEAKQINRRAIDDEVFSCEVTRQTTTGTRDFLLTTGVYDEPERFAIYTDITEQKRQKRQLEQMNERLEQQNDRLSRFASVVIHDLQSPLSVSRKAAKRAEETGDPEMFDTLYQTLDRMGAMRDELIALTQSEAQIEEMEIVDLASLAKETWRTVATAQAELVVTGLDGHGVKADRTLLAHVFENLFQNAIDHNPPPVTVTVGMLDSPTGPIGFFIEDNGTGIPREDHDRVFEYGYTTSDQGTGLGLSIVREFVVLHEWDIRVSETGVKGTRFEILDLEIVDC